MSAQLVCAHYEESLDWLRGVPEEVDVRVYHKGRIPFHVAGHSYSRLDNVGREAHTYLYHICNCYGSLAEVTLFCQGYNEDHTSVNRPVWRLLSLPPGAEMAGPFQVGPLREWNDTGQMLHYGKWALAAATGDMRMAPRTFTAWWETTLGECLLGHRGLTYYPGSIFAVTREAVLRRPKGFYESLLAQVASHKNPEEAYYLERAWPYLWKVPLDKRAAWENRVIPRMAEQESSAQIAQ